MKLRVFTAFSGYDSQCLALDRLKRDYPAFDYELIGWSEIDKYAIRAHNAIYPQWAERNYGDISRIDWELVPDFDLFTYSFPCQDISQAGNQKGVQEGSGTRSSLLWECRKAIVAKHPKYLLMENVKALVGKKFFGTFQAWLDELEGYGYANFWSVMNARDYGVPQNRERVFCVSILNCDVNYNFPKPFPLEKKLIDLCDESVAESYFISEEMIQGFIEHNKKHEEKGTGFKWEPKDTKGKAGIGGADSQYATSECSPLPNR